MVDFKGSESEKLGEGQNLFGKGAKLADVTVYGPKGEGDIQSYKGYSMSSDPKKFGAIADGEYNVKYDAIGKSGSLGSHWAVNGRGKVPALGGVNPNPDAQFNDAKTGIFIHSSNNNGFAGSKIGKDGVLHTVSTGCLLITPTQYDIKRNSTGNGWNEFNSQLKGVNEFKLILNRDK